MKSLREERPHRFSRTMLSKSLILRNLLSGLKRTLEVNCQNMFQRRNRRNTSSIILQILMMKMMTLLRQENQSRQLKNKRREDFSSMLKIRENTKKL